MSDEAALISATLICVGLVLNGFMQGQNDINVDGYDLEKAACMLSGGNLDFRICVHEQTK